MLSADRYAWLARLRSPIVAVTLFTSAYHLWAGWFGEPIAEIHRPTHLGLVLIVLFWVTPAPPWRWRFLWPLWNLVLSVTVVGACGYLALNAAQIQMRMIYVEPLTAAQIAGAVGLILAILEAARRTVGWVLVVLVVVFLAYAVLGNLLPSPLWHRGYSIDNILETAFLTQDGIWGTPVAVTASYIFLFVLFGSFLLASGAGAFFTELARALTGRATGGAAKTAVASSAFMGMLSGSSAANVVTTGSFTIPAMIRAGYRKDFAAGVEAVASAGGQFTPPIMGAAAFIMMEFVGVSYLTIIKAAIIPALLYFTAVLVMVDLEARRHGVGRALHLEAIPSVWAILRRQGYLLLSVVAMMYALSQGYTPTTAGLWAILSLLALVVAFDGHNRRRFFAICLEAMDHAPRLIGPVSTACAVGGIIIGVITLTGLGLRMSTIVLAVAGDSLLVLLVFTMIVGVILGMGMPTSGAYIILAALLAPGLTKFGVPVLAAHMFVMYAACTSAITPPVAIASYAAAAVANSNPWRTSLIAFKLGLSSFIIPYMFVYGPALLGIGGPLEVARAYATATIGVCTLSVALIGWLFVPLALPIRAFFFGAALLLIKPGPISDIVGLGLVGAAATALYVRSPRSA